MQLSLAEANEYANKMLSQKWVQWIHPGTVIAENSVQKAENAALGEISNHCGKCLNLSGCCFVTAKCPDYPLHPHCHCFVYPLPYLNVSVECPVEKFTYYIFSNEKNKGKKNIV